MKKHVCLGFVYILNAWSGFTYSQNIAVDNKLNPVFLFYTFEGVRVSIDGDDPLALTFSPFTVLKTAYQEGGVNKIWGPIITAAVTNAGDQFQKFNSIKDFQPGGKIQLGLQSSIHD